MLGQRLPIERNVVLLHERDSVRAEQCKREGGADLFEAGRYRVGIDGIGRSAARFAEISVQVPRQRRALAFLPKFFRDATVVAVCWCSPTPFREMPFAVATARMAEEQPKSALPKGET